MHFRKLPEFNPLNGVVSRLPVTALPGVEGCRSNGKSKNSGVSVMPYPHKATITRAAWAWMSRVIGN